MMAGGVAAPALADVTATADINKTKDVTVTENISITKTASILVVMGRFVSVGPDNQLIIRPFLLGSAAEATALANVTNTGNEVGPDYLFNTTTTPNNNTREADIGDQPTSGGSINGNTGITQVNQDVGDNNNQGNNVALAYTGITGSFADAEAGGDQRNTDNVVSNRALSAAAFIALGIDFGDDPRNLANSNFSQFSRIEDSINGNTGIVNVNQNSGNNNNQTNEVAAAIGVNPIFAMGEGALGQVNSGNVVKEANSSKYDEINGSVNTNHGVVNVNQSTGNMNNQMSAFAIAAAVNSDVTVRNIVGGPSQ
jgi:hypothetical protein